MSFEDTIIEIPRPRFEHSTLLRIHRAHQSFTPEFDDAQQARQEAFRTLRNLRLFGLPLALRRPREAWDIREFAVTVGGVEVRKYSVSSPVAANSQNPKAITRLFSDAVADMVAICPSELPSLGVRHDGQNASYGVFLKNESGSLVGFLTFDVELVRIAQTDLATAFADLELDALDGDQTALLLARGMTLRTRLGKMWVHPDFRGQGAGAACLAFMQEVLKEHLDCFEEQLSELAQRMRSNFEIDFSLTDRGTNDTGRAMMGKFAEQLRAFSKSSTAQAYRAFKISPLVNTSADYRFLAQHGNCGA